MTTTVELRAEQEAALRALAAERGEDDLGDVIRDAIDAYLNERSDANAGDARLQELLSLVGSIPDETAEEMRATVRRLRESW